MRNLLGALALAFTAAPAAAQAPAPAAAAPIDYATDASWLCRPGRADVCAAPLPTTVLNPNGFGASDPSRPAADATIDCFYVYPTVSRDPGMNADMNPGAQEEQGVAVIQFARFASVCRTFAPLYRSATLAMIPVAMSGTDVSTFFNLAYEDVRAAWRHYLAHDNQGRPFVLIGHSQGTIHLTRLLAEEIENDPAASARMLSALLIGANVEVPEGRAVGGSFRRTPLCTRAGQTGCVVTYVSFRDGSPPSPAALFGQARGPGNTIACTNPANLAGGAGTFDSYWFTASPPSQGAPVITWSSTGAPPTPFIRTEGLASGRCVHDGRTGYLAVSVNADPADARTDQIPGDVYFMGNKLPDWGLHLADVNLAMGNLIGLVAAQRDAYAAAHRGSR